MKIPTPEQFEQAARAVVAQKQSAIDSLNRQVAEAERKLALFSESPSIELFEESVQLESQLAARRSLAKRIDAAFSPDREYEKLLNVPQAKAVLSAYAQSKQPILQDLRSQVSKLRARAAKREEAGNSEHFDLSDQADSLADTLFSYENGLRTASEHLARFPAALDGVCNYLAIRNRLDEIQPA